MEADATCYGLQKMARGNKCTRKSNGLAVREWKTDCEDHNVKLEINVLCKLFGGGR